MSIHWEEMSEEVEKLKQELTEVRIQRDAWKEQALRTLDQLIVERCCREHSVADALREQQGRADSHSQQTKEAAVPL